MSFQKFAFISTLVCLSVGLPFPFQLDENCFINFVGTGFQTESLTPFMNRFPAESTSTYTFSIRSLCSNFSTEEDLYESAENITLQESYFRYNFKLTGSCLAFILSTPTFNDTVTAIHQSGFGTSDEVIFFVYLRTLVEWKDQLEKFSALHLHSPYVFHANVVFMGINSSYSGVHCYFCPPNPLRLHPLHPSSFQTFVNLKRFVKKLNSDGHG
ncbi:unnamed protein product [Orchesella dallaii]|uniref:Uncharacterized protein n=1 Tax=Orchesella dallaii TaxID=48710 RepID=A0ABP1PSM4_9HEXA